MNKDKKVFIEIEEFQQKILDAIGKDDFDKWISNTIFNGKEEFKPAIVHGMTLAACIASTCQKYIGIEE